MDETIRSSVLINGGSFFTADYDYDPTAFLLVRFGVVPVRKCDTDIASRSTPHGDRRRRHAGSTSTDHCLVFRTHRVRGGTGRPSVLASRGREGYVAGSADPTKRRHVSRHRQCEGIVFNAGRGAETSTPTGRHRGAQCRQASSRGAQCPFLRPSRRHASGWRRTSRGRVAWSGMVRGAEIGVLR